MKVRMNQNMYVELHAGVAEKTRLQRRRLGA